jgi:hypothetical protein
MPEARILNPWRVPRSYYLESRFGIVSEIATTLESVVLLGNHSTLRGRYTNAPLGAVIVEDHAVNRTSLPTMWRNSCVGGLWFDLYSTEYTIYLS